MFQFLAVGDLIIDTQVRIDDSSAECRVIPHENAKLCFDYGGKIPIIDSFQSLGGNAANVAVGAARFGLKSGVVSTVGKDVGGEMAVKQLAKFGVNTRYVTLDPKAQTRYSIVLNYKEERTILSYSSRKDYAWPEPAPETGWIYYTGLGEGFEKLHDGLMKYLAKHRSVKLAFNPGSYLMKYGRSFLPEIVDRADLLIVNLEEAASILGTDLKKEKSPTALVRSLLQRGSNEVVMTDAERGAWAGSKNGIWHMKAFPVPVVAKTGAGDSFSAGYIAARHFEHDIKHALAYGIANGASVVQHEDCHTGLLDQKGVERLLKRFPNIVPNEV